MQGKSQASNMRKVNCFVFLSAFVFLCGVHGAPEAGCDRSSCSKFNLGKLYKELNCQPVYDNNDCCPIKYDCSKFSLRSIDKCHFQGEEYELHARVSQNKTSINCLAACGCYAREEKAYFNCAHIECAELFNGPLRDPGCFRQYSHDSCCSTSTHCFNETTAGEKQNIHQCTYGGKQYYKGQKFYPDNECKVCICDEGYDGSSNEPWCREFPCNVELIYGKYLDDGCVPIYYKSGCCPIDWRCPSSNDTIIEGPNHQNPSPETEEKELFCMFGSLKLYLQDKLGDDSSNSDCTCITPPYPTCNLKPRPGAS